MIAPTMQLYAAAAGSGAGDLRSLHTEGRRATRADVDAEPLAEPRPAGGASP